MFRPRQRGKKYLLPCATASVSLGMPPTFYKSSYTNTNSVLRLNYGTRRPKWAQIEAELYVLSMRWLYFWIWLGLSRYWTVCARPGKIRKLEKRRERLCDIAS